MPPSALLGRLQAFLPELEEANRTTEKLAKEGKLEVLDTNLEEANTDQPKEEAEATDEEEEEEEEDEEEAEGTGAGGGEGDEGLPPPKTIQLVSEGVVYRYIAQTFLPGIDTELRLFLPLCAVYAYVHTYPWSPAVLWSSSTFDHPWDPWAGRGVLYPAPAAWSSLARMPSTQGSKQALGYSDSLTAVSCGTYVNALKIKLVAVAT